MEQKKKKYEEEIAAVLRKVMEVSYLRKKNIEKATHLLRRIRKEPAENASPEELIQEYFELKKKILNNIGLNE